MEHVFTVNISLVSLPVESRLLRYEAEKRVKRVFLEKLLQSETDETTMTEYFEYISVDLFFTTLCLMAFFFFFFYTNHQANEEWI